MIEPRYILSTPSWDEWRRWVAEREAEVARADRKRRQRGRRT